MSGQLTILLFARRQLLLARGCELPTLTETLAHSVMVVRVKAPVAGGDESDESLDSNVVAEVELLELITDAGITSAAIKA